MSWSVFDRACGPRSGRAAAQVVNAEVLFTEPMGADTLGWFQVWRTPALRRGLFHRWRGVSAGAFVWRCWRIISRCSIHQRDAPLIPGRIVFKYVRTVSLAGTSRGRRTVSIARMPSPLTRHQSCRTLTSQPDAEVLPRPFRVWRRLLRCGELHARDAVPSQRGLNRSAHRLSQRRDDCAGRSGRGSSNSPTNRTAPCRGL